MSQIKNLVSALMRRVRKGRLPSSRQVVDEAFSELGFVDSKLSPEEIKAGFNSLLHTTWVKTLEVLERYERSAYGENVADELIGLRGDDFLAFEAIAARGDFRGAVRELFKRWYPYLVEIFLSISQSRKQRGGKDFELQFGRLLELMCVPHERLDRKYRVDFVMPNGASFEANRTSGVIASAKRTLRERWREVVEELHNTRAPNIFLVTADFDVSEGHVREICRKYNIHLVVWDEVKTGKFPNEPLVLGYTEWANVRLPALRQFWN